MRTTLVVLWLSSCATGGPRTGPVELVGSRGLNFADPITGQPMEAVAFYPPAERSTGVPRHVGLWDVAAQSELPPASGKRPLVVISHGHLGSRYGHHDLAAALARAGMVALAVEHRGDSYNDGSLAGTERLMLGRPRQISAAIDAALADPVLGGLVDERRVGVAGFSAGGYTALAVVGATPDFSLGVGYCARHPADRALCPGTRYESASQAPSLKDARVRAAFVMAPLAVFFGERALEAIDVPVYLSYAEADDVLLPDEHARRVAEHVKTLAAVDRIAGAWHSVYLAPCDGPGDGGLCADAAGVDRRAEHRRLNEAAVEFFGQL